MQRTISTSCKVVDKKLFAQDEKLPPLLSRIQACARYLMRTCPRTCVTVSVCVTRAWTIAISFAIMHMPRTNLPFERSSPVTAMISHTRINTTTEVSS